MAGYRDVILSDGLEKTPLGLVSLVEAPFSVATVGGGSGGELLSDLTNGQIGKRGEHA